MKLPATIVAVLALAPLTYSQTEVSEKTATKHAVSVSADAPDGTYYFENSGKAQDVFTTDIFAQIESRRKVDEIVHWQYSVHTTIIILSKNQIQASGFEPVEMNLPWEE